LIIFAGSIMYQLALCSDSVCSECFMHAAQLSFLSVWIQFTIKNVCAIVSLSGVSWAHRLALTAVSCSPSWSCKTMDTGPVHCVVCLFTPQLLLVHINRPRRDGTFSWHWYTAASGGIIINC